MTMQQMDVSSRFTIQNIDAYVDRKWAVTDCNGIIYAMGASPNDALVQFRQDYPSVTNAAHIPIRTAPLPNKEDANQSLRGADLYTDDRDTLRNLLQRKEQEIKRLQTTLESSDNYRKFEALQERVQYLENRLNKVLNKAQYYHGMKSETDTGPFIQLLEEIEDMINRADV